MKSGLGFWLLSDDAGDGLLKTIKAAGIYSYRVRVRNDLYMKMGIEIGIVQSTLNWDRLRFGDQIDDYLGATSPGGTPFPTEEFTPEKNSIIYPDLGFGFVLNNKIMYTGLSIRHLNTPNPEYLRINPNLSSGIPMRWTAHAGATIPLSSTSRRKTLGTAFSPSLVYVKQGPFQQINGGVTFDAGPVNFGGYYRLSAGQSEAVIVAIGFRTKHLKIGYSYDVTISGFPSSGGTHELGLVYAKESNHSDSKYSDCLRLFR
jgi:type IX secretion system PorP/SprF family membrane protein